MFGFPLWSVLALIDLGSLAFLVFIMRLDKPQAKWVLFFHLVMLGLVNFYLYHSFSGAALDRLPEESWPWIVAGAIAVIVFPFALYWIWLALVSAFLLPVEPRWRDWQAAAQTLISFARGVNYPYYSDKEGNDELEKRLDGSIMTKFGGPGLVLVRPEHVAALHGGPKLTRVEGGDVIFTGRRERVLHIVDLRIHVLVITNITAMTKDGISVKFVMLALCRIEAPDASTQPRRLYPYNQGTVFKIVCDQQDVDNKEKQAWYDMVVLKARKVARDVVSTYMLDRMLTAEDPKKVPRSEIRDKVRERLIAELAGTGIRVIGAGLSNIQPDVPPPDDKPRPAGEEKLPWVDVTQQRVTSWGVDLQQQAVVSAARSEARATIILEKARAQALAEFICAVAEGFRKGVAAGEATPNDVIALSFINAVEQMLAGQDAPDELGVASTRSTMQTLRRMMLLDR